MVTSEYGRLYGIASWPVRKGLNLAAEAGSLAFAAVSQFLDTDPISLQNDVPFHDVEMAVGSIGYAIEQDDPQFLGACLVRAGKAIERGTEHCVIMLDYRLQDAVATIAAREIEIGSIDD